MTVFIYIFVKMIHDYYKYFKQYTILKTTKKKMNI